MPKTVYNVLFDAGIISKDLRNLRTMASRMWKIPDDVAELLTIEQKTSVIKSRYSVCKEFQTHLELFWKKHYRAETWKIAVSYLDATKDDKPDMDKVLNDAYLALTKADFNVSHEGNRNLESLNNFLKKGTGYSEEELTWAMMSASSMPSTFLSAHDIYMGRTEIDIRPFHPTLDFYWSVLGV